MIDASESLPVEQACQAYIKIDRLIESCQHEDGNGEAQYLQFLTNVHEAVENRMVQRVAMATKCQSWKNLPKAKQTAIMQLGFFSPIDDNPHSSRPANKMGEARASLKRHVSLNATRPPRQETSRPHERAMPPANRSSPVPDRSSIGRSNFQRNGLRSTAPRLRNADELTAGRSESASGSQTSSVPGSRRRPCTRADATQRASASPGAGRRPQWR